MQKNDLNQVLQACDVFSREEDSNKTLKWL